MIECTCLAPNTGLAAIGFAVAEAISVSRPYHQLFSDEAHMNSGYVYILVNRGFPELIKVGRTVRDSRARARELSTTALPYPFQVAFEVFSPRHEELESTIHAELTDFRVAANREFFRYPLDKAINLVQTLAARTTDPDSQYVAEDITGRLQERYPGYLRPEIAAVRIVQSSKRVWLEITEENEVAGYLKDQTIFRSDLAFIIEDNAPDGLLFPPGSDVRENARKFVEEFDEYSIIMTTRLFHRSACEEIDARHRDDLPPGPRAHDLPDTPGRSGAG